VKSECDVYLIICIFSTDISKDCINAGWGLTSWEQLVQQMALLLIIRSHKAHSSPLPACHKILGLYMEEYKQAKENKN